ncbi:OsmC family protein [Microbacterium terrisoli]|jgi:organic hydroperoxide reductase OsmC/OhrA|uniref:OsmC family protein n=1 Tax=Microbacterium terrisoli TaxID=3242192 RepID=UPI002805AD9C|nr:OsmC family protein [Microbacterium protaetiae]
MSAEHTYRLRTVWTGDRGTGTSGYRDYDRSVTISAEGRPDLLASADRTFHGDRSRWNPEDMLVAALSECHLLSYLHAAVKAGVVVTGYDDEATGVMAEDGRGGGAFTEVVLRPHVTVAEAAMVDAATAAHRQAHEWCFIANSVNFPVRVEPEVAVRAARGAEPA